MSNKPEQPSADAKKLSLGIVFLTIFIDLVGFSIIFPLFPAILEHYGQSGLLQNLTNSLDAFSEATGAGDRFTPVLFGGVLGSLYAALQFFFAPIWGSLSDQYGRRSVLLVTPCRPVTQTEKSSTFTSRFQAVKARQIIIAEV